MPTLAPDLTAAAECRIVHVVSHNVTVERRVSGITDRRQYVRSLVSRRNEDCQLCCIHAQDLHRARRTLIARLRSFTPDELTEWCDRRRQLADWRDYTSSGERN